MVHLKELFWFYKRMTMLLFTKNFQSTANCSKSISTIVLNLQIQKKKEKAKEEKKTDEKKSEKEETKEEKNTKGKTNKEKTHLKEQE